MDAQLRLAAGGAMAMRDRERRGVVLRRRWLAASATAWLLLISPAAANQPAVVPHAEGLDVAIAAARDLPRLHSLLVSRRGSLVVERYFNGARAQRPANVKSVSKSVISALVGLAIERRQIDGVGQPIWSFFPDLQKGGDARKRQITIEDLLTMRSGLESTSNRNYGAWVLSRNWVQFALNRPMLADPGTTMDYSTGNTHLLSAILTKATGASTWQFAQKALGGPLGISLPQWPRDPQGIYFGGNDMLLTPRQMVAFGELYLNRGRVGDRQVLPAAWVDASLEPRGRSQWSEQQYGYGWWIRDLAGHHSYNAWGYGGQFIFVVPDLQLVVVTTSSTATGEERRGHRRTVLDVVERFVVPAVAASASR
ncbi:MAG: serine hydrolase [Luteitalea sp.]|nr:serine hydrolase [Luteitalea sp.]